MRSSLAVLLRPLAVLTAGLGFAGCASSGGDMPASGTTEVYNQLQTDYGVRSISLRTVEDVHVRGDTLAYEGDDLFRHLAATYDEMGIPLNQVNAEARLLGAVEARMKGDLGGRPLSRYFRCGTSITGDIADQYEVYVTVITQLESVEEAGTGVYTHARAFAVQGGRSGNEIRCATRARLEREIVEHFERKLASES